MNLLDLHVSSVHFDERTHTYTTSDGLQLSGVTSIIKQVLFPDKYKGIPESVLAKAAECGTAIHNECERINIFGEGMLNEDSSVEARNYHRLMADNGIKMIASEYLVSDEAMVATMIDCIDDQGNLYDIKTTAQLDTESLSWQLSICDYLFSRQNSSLARHSSKLYGIWLRGDIAKLVEVERKTDEQIEALFQAYLNGEVLTSNVMELSDTEETALAKLNEQEELIIEFKNAIERLEQEKQANLNLLREKMEREGIKKLETPRLLVTLVADSTTTTFDSKRFKEEHPELASQYTKLSSRKGYVKITLR